jgi:hypothetical protein
LSYANVEKLQLITSVDDWRYSLTDSVINVGIDLAVNQVNALKSAVAGIIAGSQNSVPVVYTLLDTIANLMFPLPGTLNGATSITVADSVVNLLSSDPDVQAFLETPGLNIKVEGNVTGDLSADAALNLALITTDHSYLYTVSDTAAELLAGKLSVLNKAVGVTVNDVVASDLTVANHNKLEGITHIDHNYDYTIADTATNIAAATSGVSTVQTALEVKATATAAADIIDSLKVSGDLTVVYTTATQATEMDVQGSNLKLIGADADVISNFGSTDKIDLSAFVVSVDNSSDVQSGGTISDGGFAIVKGYWGPMFQGFTTGGPEMDTMIVWDADNGVGVTQVAVVLTGTITVSIDNLDVHTV